MTKRVVIYTMSCGDGHNMISNTLKKTFEKYHGDECEVKVVDYYKDYWSPFRSFICDQFFRFTMEHAHWFYHIMYGMYRKDNLPKSNPLGIRYVQMGKYKKILGTIEDFKPDLIIGSHIFTTMALTDLKNQGKVDIPFYCIITDYTVYPLVEYSLGVEKIITPSDKLTDELIQKGYRDDQIACLGFPVRMNRPEERPNSGRKNLSLLIMAGPGRIKSIDKDIKDLLIADLDIHVVVLNGKDEKHRRKVDRIIAGLRHERTVIENLGFVDDAAYESILNECDIIVSKCGANTLSEAVMMGKIIITSPDLVGQELDNLSYFSERVPIFLIDEKKGIAGILRENTFDQDYLDEYWSLTDGMIPSDGYKRYVDLFYGSE